MTDPQPVDATPPLGWLLASAGERAASAFRAALPTDLHPRQFAVLQLLAGSGPTTQAEVARALSIPPSRVVAIADQLEDERLLRRESDPRDRRIRRLALTPAGVRLLDDLATVVDGTNDEVAATLTTREREQLRRLLIKMIGEPHVW